MAISISPRTGSNRSLAEVTPRLRCRPVLPEADHQQLLLHLEVCEKSRGPSWTLLAYVLQNKLVNSEPVSTPVDRDIVIGGSLVSYSVGGGAPAHGLLVHRVRPGIQKGDVIRVASLLGATLIGLRAGQRAPLLCEDGSVKSLLVLDSVPPA